MTKNLYFRRVRASAPETKSLPMSEVLRDILLPHYWPEANGDATCEPITLKPQDDKTYLKGLHDGGSPGAGLLLGLIEADGGVVIWIGE
jgi:hypothetical protein